MAAGSALIQKAARERLRPMSLFQWGSSRRGWNVRDAWNGGMLRYLSGDLAAGDARLDAILERKPRDSGTGWTEELRQLAEETRTLPDRRAFVTGSIREKRARLRSRASDQKLSVGPLYG